MPSIPKVSLIFFYLLCAVKQDIPLDFCVTLHSYCGRALKPVPLPKPEKSEFGSYIDMEKMCMV